MHIFQCTTLITGFKKMNLTSTCANRNKGGVKNQRHDGAQAGKEGVVNRKGGEGAGRQLVWKKGVVLYHLKQ